MSQQNRQPVTSPGVHLCGGNLGSTMGTGAYLLSPASALPPFRRSHAMPSLMLSYVAVVRRSVRVDVRPRPRPGDEVSLSQPAPCSASRVGGTVDASWQPHRVHVLAHPQNDRQIGNSS